MQVSGILESQDYNFYNIHGWTMSQDSANSQVVEIDLLTYFLNPYPDPRHITSHIMPPLLGITMSGWYKCNIITAKIYGENV